METNWGCEQDSQRAALQTGTRQVQVDTRALIAATGEAKHESKRKLVPFIMLYRDDDKCIVCVQSLQLQMPLQFPRIGLVVITR